MQILKLFLFLYMLILSELDFQLRNPSQNLDLKLKLGKYYNCHPLLLLYSTLYYSS